MQSVSARSLKSFSFWVVASTRCWETARGETPKACAASTTVPRYVCADRLRSSLPGNASEKGPRALSVPCVASGISPPGPRKRGRMTGTFWSPTKTGSYRIYGSRNTIRIHRPFGVVPKRFLLCTSPGLLSWTRGRPSIQSPLLQRGARGDLMRGRVRCVRRLAPRHTEKISPHPSLPKRGVQPSWRVVICGAHPGRCSSRLGLLYQMCH